MAGVVVLQEALVDQGVLEGMVGRVVLVGRVVPKALVGQEVQALVVAHHQSSLVTASSSTEHSNCNQPKRRTPIKTKQIYKQINNCKLKKKEGIS